MSRAHNFTTVSFTLVSFLAAACAAADVPWFTDRCYAIERTIDFELIDLDADDDLDVVTRWSMPVMYPNDGMGGFGEPLPTEMPQTFVPCVYADIDRDGVVDAVGRWPADQIVVVYRGRGDGTFELLSETPLPIPVTTMTVGDLNGDDELDCVVFTWGHTMITLLGTGGGSFDVGPYRPINHRCTQAFIMDATSDGINDLVVLDSSESDQIHVYANDGTGALTYEAASPWMSKPPTLATCELNGDGMADFVTLLDDQLQAYLSDGAGRYAMLLLDGSIPAVLAGVTDLDADGDDDIVVIPDEGVRVLRHQGDLQFEIEELEDGGPQRSYARLGDVDADGSTDLVAIEQMLYVTFGEDGSFRRAPITRPCPSRRATGRYYVHFNDDPFIDIVRCGGEVPEFRCALGDGAGHFEVIASVPMPLHPFDHLTADIHAAAGPEILWVDRDDLQLHVTSSPDDAIFSHTMTYAYVVLEHLLAVSDLSGDGRPDIIGVLPDDLGGMLAIVRQTDGEQFALPAVIQGVEHPDIAVAFDLDADGDTDVVAASRYSGDVYVLRNNGYGAMELAQSFIDVGRLDALVIHDEDGDAWPDLHIVQKSRILTAFNMGDGALAWPIIIYESAAEIDALVDLDGDGTMDVVGRSTDSVLLDDRSTSTPGTLHALPGYPGSFVDLDGDGDIDITGTCYVAWNTAIYECAGDLNDDRHRDMQDLGALLASFGLLPDDPYFNPDADLNGDGTVDLTDLGELLAVFDAPCG